MCLFEVKMSIRHTNGDIETLPVVPEGTHISDVLTDEAVKYLKANKENPFLLCLWYYDVHAPYQAKEDLKKSRNSA